MTDAPERRWLWSEVGNYTQNQKTYVNHTEYVRADIHEAEVVRLKMILRQIVEWAHERPGYYPVWIDDARSALAHDQPAHDQRDGNQGADQE